MGKEENRITRAIRDCLRGLGIFHWKVAQGHFAVKGVPDIIGIWPKHLNEHPAGRLIGIEVKTASGRLTKHQKMFLESIRLHGGIAIVVRDVDDLIDGLGVRSRFLF